MPLFTTAVTEYTTHIFDPMINLMVNRLIYSLGYKEIFGERIEIKTNYLGVSKTSTHDNNVQLRDSRFLADVTINMQGSSVKWPVFNFNHTAAYGVNHLTIRNQNPIFMDRDAKVSILEQSTPCSIMLACRMCFLNKMHAYQTPHMLANMFGDGNILEVNDLCYDYQIPGDLGKIMQVLHSIRGLPGAFLDYMHAGSSGIISVDLNYHGDRPELVVRKTQMHCLYSVEYTDEQPSAEETGSSPNEFVVPFTFTFQFAVPNLLFLEYPIVINNNLVPEECIYINTLNTPPGLQDSNTVKSMDDYYQQYRLHPKSCFVNPFYEDWSVPSDAMPRRYTQDPFYIGTLLIDDPHTEMDIDLIGDLGDNCHLAPELIEILRKQGSGSFEYNCIYNVSIYKDNFILDPSELRFDENMHLKFYARDTNFIYRVVISQIQDIFSLHPKWWDLVFEYRDYIDLERYLEPLFNKHVPYWKLSSQGFYFDPRTRGVYNPKTKDILFFVDETGRIYRTISGKLGSQQRIYLNDQTFKPTGGTLNGSYTTLRILRADITRQA